MKTKLNTVFAVVVKVAGNKISRFEAAEVAAVLIKKAGGDVKRAVEMAATPYIVGGNISW